MSSQAGKISDARLNFVDRNGRVQQSVALQACSGVLVSRSIIFPQGSFKYHLVGTDSHGIYFTYNTKINATFVPSYNLTSIGSSIVTIRKRSIATIRFVLRGNAGCTSFFSFSSSSVSGFSTRISPSNATVSNGQPLYLTLSVIISNSRVTGGTSRTLTILGSSGNIVVTATRRIIVEELEVSNPLNCSFNSYSSDYRTVCIYRSQLPLPAAVRMEEHAFFIEECNAAGV